MESEAISVSLCVILFEVAEESDVPELSFKSVKYLPKPDSNEVPEDLKFGSGDTSKTRGLRTPVQYTVETFFVTDTDEEGEVDMDARGEGAGAVGESDGIPKRIHYVSGNSFVEVTKGIIHLYQENERKQFETTGNASPSDMIVMLSIPCHISCRDLLQFLAPFRRDLDHIKIIREGIPNQYMALIKCKSETAAASFYQSVNGTPYSSLEEEVCKLAFVSRVESMKAEGETEIGLPLLGHTELPTCPVCLERMDESVDGVLTILCNHTFHSSCLAKWSDSRCPVCRYVQTPEMVEKNKCFECGSSDSLWICLICGHIGCGRYAQGHAYKHFCETNHCYAIQPDNNRVWDYIGDNFVHRLLQNKDGKLVESGHGPQEGECDTEKVDHLQLEFTYTLTTQLESQRHYFDQLMACQAEEFEKKLVKMELKMGEMADKIEHSERASEECKKEKAALLKKTNAQQTKINKLMAELKDERELNKSLQAGRDKWNDIVVKLKAEFDAYKLKKEAETLDLNEQLRDITFYMEAQAKIGASEHRDDIVGGQVFVPEEPSSSKGRRKKKK